MQISAQMPLLSFFKLAVLTESNLFFNVILLYEGEID